jgi:hypothetical protein
MNKVKAISPKLVIHYLELDPDDKRDKELLDNLIDREWRIVKSEEERIYIPIKSLYEKLL